MEFQERDIFLNPLNADDILGIIGNGSASLIFSNRSLSVRKMKINLDSLTEKEMITLMSQEPRLIKRPIVILYGVIFAGINEASLMEILHK